jgi:putative transposase
MIIRAHLTVLAGTDLFTVEVFTLRGLATYYVLLFFIHLGSRKVDIAGITVHPNEQWMQQMARERNHGGNVAQVVVCLRSGAGDTP